MGSSHAKRPKTATAVEPVHYTENEAENVRAQARADAQKRFGTLGTDVTRGSATQQVLGGNDGRKKKTLGGE